MSQKLQRGGGNRETREFDKHTKTVKAKAERIQGLKALILTHETAKGLYDAKYVGGLRARLRAAETQFKSMA